MPPHWPLYLCILRSGQREITSLSKLLCFVAAYSIAALRRQLYLSKKQWKGDCAAQHEIWLQVCVEVVGYLLEELRDANNFESFREDMQNANIFIGSLIFIEELADKVSARQSLPAPLRQLQRHKDTHTHHALWL